METDEMRNEIQDKIKRTRKIMDFEERIEYLEERLNNLESILDF